MSAEPDPTRPGPHAVESFEYDAGDFLVRYGTRTTYFEHLRGAVHHPKRGSHLPVILLLHGNHGTCRVVFYETLTPCAETPATHDVPSHSGYEYLAQNLASHGYFVVSASANGTNGDSFTSEDSGTRGRVEVIHRTLELVASWAAKPQPEPVGRSLLGRLDLSRIGLMGHSRGGEAVTRFIAHNRIDLQGRWRLRAVVALAATDFAKHRPIGVPFAALLPTCDGDVYDLQGSHAFERAADDAPRVQWVVRGANHNFFNSVWTSDDGGSNKSSPCSRGAERRLTVESQQQVGVSLIGAFLRRFVGGEFELDAAATWRPHQLEGACGPTCGDVVRATFLPAGATPLGMPAGEDQRALSITYCDAQGMPCPSRAHRSWTPQMFLHWGQTSELALDAPSPDLRGRSIVLRVAVDREHKQNAGPPAVSLRVVDVRGRAAMHEVRQDALRPLDEWVYGEGGWLTLSPETNGPPHVVLSDVRVPTSAFARVDLKHIRSISLVLGGRGAMYLAGATLQ